MIGSDAYKQIVKICGVRSDEDVLAAFHGFGDGPDFVGLVFAANSPRALPKGAAAGIVADTKQMFAQRGFRTPKFVGLFVDPDDATLKADAEALDFIQLHGRETPDQVAAAAAATGKPVIKAVGVRTGDDVKRAAEYDAVAEMILLDAKPPVDADRTGGLGKAFDWSLIAGYAGASPFLLAGGLTPDNVAAAIAAAAPNPRFAGVDVSSGVEETKGEKSPNLMRAFMAAARSGFRAVR